MFPDPGSKNRSVKLFFSPPLPVSLFRSGGFSPALQAAPDLLFFSKIAASLAPHWQFFLSEVSIPLNFVELSPVVRLVQIFQLVIQVFGFDRFLCLYFQRTDFLSVLNQCILKSLHIFQRFIQFTDRLFSSLLEFCDSGSFFKKFSSVVVAVIQDLFYHFQLNN